MSTTPCRVTPPLGARAQQMTASTMPQLSLWPNLEKYATALNKHRIPLPPTRDCILRNPQRGGPWPVFRDRNTQNNPQNGKVVSVRLPGSTKPAQRSPGASDAECKAHGQWVHLEAAAKHPALCSTCHASRLCTRKPVRPASAPWLSQGNSSYHNGANKSIESRPQAGMVYAQ